jgi:hypothetical protein
LRYGFEQAVDDLINPDALGFGVEIGEDAVAQYGGGDLADVFAGNVVAAAK